MGAFASMFRSGIRSNVAQTFATNVCLTGIGFVNSMFLARWLGSAGRGELAATFLWPTLLIYLCAFGLIPAVAYHAALPDSSPGKVAGSAFSCAVWQGAAALAGGYILIPLLLHSQSRQVIADSRLYLWVVPLIIVSQYGQAVLQGRLHFKHLNGLRAVVPAGYLLGTLVLHQAGLLSARNIVFLHITLQVLVAILTIRVSRGLGFLDGLGMDRGVVKKLLGYGGKVYAGEVTSTANLRLDQILMAALFPPEMLGVYVVAVSSASIPEMFASAVRMVSSAKIAAVATPEARREQLVSTFRKYIAISLPGILLMALVLPFAIPLVFGREFEAAIVPAEVLLVGSLLLGIRGVLAGGAQALGDPWIGSKAEVCSLPVTSALLLLLMPKFGILGAAIASVLSYATQVAVIAAGLRRHGVAWDRKAWSAFGRFEEHP